MTERLGLAPAPPLALPRGQDKRKGLEYTSLVGFLLLVMALASGFYLPGDALARSTSQAGAQGQSEGRGGGRPLPQPEGPAKELEAPFAAMYPKREPFDRAIAGVKPLPGQGRVTGVVVPHHLLAADLMALGLSRAADPGAGSVVDRVIILCPDHFRKSATPFATTGRDFDTALGPATTDRDAVQALVRNPLVSRSALFAREHGIQALLPFIVHYFPKARIVPLAARISATAAECDRLAATLGPLVTPNTLIVQSTDFSHYLTDKQAARKDQETLNALAQGDAERLFALHQPGNLDTKAAMYLHTVLQQRLLGAGPSVVANRNASHYAKRPVERSTSYMVALYGPGLTISASTDGAAGNRLSSDAAPRRPVPVFHANGVDGERFVLAGDTFFGRLLARPLADAQARKRLVEQVLAITGGARLVVNLEGVLRPECGAPASPYELCMENSPALELLKGMNVAAVSLANNHSHDFGPEAYAAMKAQLLAAGILVLEHGQVTDLGPLRLAAFTDLDNGRTRRASALPQEALDALSHPSGGKPCDGPANDTPLDAAQADKPQASLPKAKPLIAFMHWGREFAAVPGPRERLVAGWLEAKGVDIIVGSHPHVASGLECGASLCQAYSLGNFLFDQTRLNAGGSLLEVTVFPQGTWFTRLIPVGNLARALLGGRQN